MGGSLDPKSGIFLGDWGDLGRFMDPDLNL
jgi:hypothetical protein